MILDLTISSDKHKAQVYFDKLLANMDKIELKKISPKRSLNQNSYLHAILAIYGGEWGLTTEEAKISVKRTLGYVYEKNGELFLKHTSDMDVKELTTFIDRLRNHSSSLGCYLPSSDEFQTDYVEIMKQVQYIEGTMNRYGQ